MPAQVESDVLRARGGVPGSASVPWAWLVAVDAIEAGGVIAGKGHIVTHRGSPAAARATAAIPRRPDRGVRAGNALPQPLLRAQRRVRREHRAGGDERHRGW